MSRTEGLIKSIYYTIEPDIVASTNQVQPSIFSGSNPCSSVDRVETVHLRAFLPLLIFVASIFAGLTLAETPSRASCKIQPANFEGWKAQQISNRWVTLTVVPQLGGRVMQITFGNHPYLFVNSQLKGKYFPPLGGAATGKWFNYGGDKIWPLPEGTEDAQHWPGPISDALDDGDNDFKVLSHDAVCAVRLEGPADPRTGLQYSREISLGSDSPEITFHAVMKNATDHPIRWSMQSVTQYDTPSADSPNTYSRDFWAFTAINPNSAYDSGYRVRLGPSSDPAYSAKNGLFALHWLYFEREVWLDSASGWLAVVDGSTHYAMVERFPHLEAEYPGKATIIFYTNGPALEFNEEGMPFLTSSNPAETPFYMKAEVNSPMVVLKPGETYALDTKWFPTRIVGHPQSVTEVGVTSSALVVSKMGNSLLVSASFGVFFPGSLAAYLFDIRGAKTGVVPLQSVSPLDTVDVHTEIPASPLIARLSIHLIDERGMDRGSLAEVSIVKVSRAP